MEELQTDVISPTVIGAVASISTSLAGFVISTAPNQATIDGTQFPTASFPYVPQTRVFRAGLQRQQPAHPPDPAA